MIRARTSLLAALAALALVAALGGVGTAAQNPGPGPTKPVAEQNLDENGWIRVHEQGVASVDVTNDNLDVTLANDEINVNVTNPVLGVSGTVDVGNFPAQQNVAVQNFPSTQDVNVVGGSTGPQPASAVRQVVFSLDPGESQTQTFPTIDVSSVVISSGDEEYQLFASTPLWNGDILLAFEPDGDNPSRHFTFPQPLPLNGLNLYCANESEHCPIYILLIGS